MIGRAAPAALDEAVALVTGASSGIGADLARELARRGVGRVILVARRRARLDDLARELGPVARVRVADLARPDHVASLRASEPRVDILVNNAGFGWGAPFAEQGADRLSEMIDLNCRAVVNLTHAWLPGMLERHRGWILNVGSISGLFPVPTMAVYGATKAFVHSFTEALRVEMRGTGVHVHLLAPGPVHTEFFHVAHPGHDRPAGALFLSSERVARQAVGALFADQARLIPGLPFDLGARLAGKLPMLIYRPLATLATGITSRLSSRTRRSSGSGASR